MGLYLASSPHLRPALSTLTLHHHQEVSLLVACIDALVQLLLADPGNPYSTEGWHCASAGQEEGSRRPLQSLPLPPYCPDITCKQGVHQLGEEKMASLQ